MWLKKRKECVNLIQQGSAVFYSWFLPVIRELKELNFLMTDKIQSSMYLENHILKEEKIESSKKKISRHPRDIPKGISKEENQRPEGVTLYT